MKMAMDAGLMGERGTKREHIRQMVKNYLLAAGVSADTRIPTTRALAKEFDVSYVTMHSALDDLVRDGWLVRHQGKGTFVVDASARKRRPATSRFAVVFPPQEAMQVSRQADLMMEILQGCTAGARLSQGEIGVLSLPPDEAEAAPEGNALGQVLAYDGAVFVGDEFAALMHALRRRGYPFVTIASDSGVWDCTVHYDRKAAVKLAAEHLAGHGYREIGYFGAIRDSNRKYPYFREFAEEFGLRIKPEHVWHCPEPTDAPSSVRGFLDAPRLPDAVFADNYLKAETLVNAAVYHELHVPQDLPVLAYGTEQRGGIELALSIVRVPAEEMGREAALYVDQLVRGASVASTHKVLKAALVRRESCGCARKGDGASDE